MVKPTSMPFLHLFQALLLLRRENRRNLAVRFGNRFADMPAGVAANFFELGARCLGHRRNLSHLLFRQPKSPLQTAVHRASANPATMCAEQITRCGRAVTDR